jgi:hypothetical protein
MAQIMHWVEHLQATLGVRYLFIGHDLARAEHVSHCITVVYLGELVELTGRPNPAPIRRIPTPKRCRSQPCEPTLTTNSSGPLPAKSPAPLLPFRVIRRHTLAAARHGCDGATG